MRKSKLETAATRVKIIEAARAVFRRKGLEGSGLTGLMAVAGLTQGGFYKHFESKAHLVEQATTASVDQLVEALQRSAASVGRAEAISSTIKMYLSPDHRDSDTGCPYAALAGELAREDQTVRSSAIAGFERVLDFLSSQILDAGGAAPRSEAMLIICAMMGALTVSRMAEGFSLSEEVLTEVQSQLLRMAD